MLWFYALLDAAFRSGRGGLLYKGDAFPLFAVSQETDKFIRFWVYKVGDVVAAIAELLNHQHQSCAVSVSFLFLELKSFVAQDGQIWWFG